MYNVFEKKTFQDDLDVVGEIKEDDVDDDDEEGVEADVDATLHANVNIILKSNLKQVSSNKNQFLFF